MATNSERSLRRYHKNLESGKCPRCGKKKRKSYNFQYCEDCLSAFRTYYSQYSEEANKKRTSLYAERKANHQCPRCGKRLRKNYTKIQCPECLEKQRK